jgi:hypothetical protein
MGADYRTLLPEFPAIVGALFSRNHFFSLLKKSLGVRCTLCRCSCCRLETLHLRLPTNRGNYRPPTGSTQYCR